MFHVAIEEIREAIPKMTPQQQKVGIYFCEHPETLGELSLSDFALKTGTSGPTVNRFCKSLGYSGFLEFSRTMHNMRSRAISHASHFRYARIQNEKSGDCGSLGRQLVEKEAANLRQLAENYPAEKISACVARMNECAAMAVIGKMSACPAAIYFEQLLAKITPKLVPMQGSDVLQAAALSRLDKNSLVFSLAFPRYPKIAVELSKEASRRGAGIIAITGSGFSPLAEMASILFAVDIEIFSYIDLLDPVFALINVICLEFSLGQGNQSERDLARYDRIVEDAFFMTPRKNEPNTP